MFSSDVKTMLKPAFAVPATTKLHIVKQNTKTASTMRANDKISLFSPLCIIPLTLLITSSILQQSASSGIDFSKVNDDCR